MQYHHKKERPRQHFPKKKRDRQKVFRPRCTVFSAILYAVSLLVLPAFVTATPLRGQAPEENAQIRIEGRGFGHGRGLGQWGALGYALAGVPYQEILAHYYGGTKPGSFIPDRLLRVRIVENDGAALQVTSAAPFHVAQWEIPASGAARARRSSSGHFLIEQGESCTGPWTQLGTVDHPPLFTPSHPDARAGVMTAPHNTLLQLCISQTANETTGETTQETIHWLRGTLEAQEENEQMRTVNILPLATYLIGVVPQEMPAYWATQGEGRGAHALRAQAVAARSYVASDMQANNGHGKYLYADTCNTATCQVYRGAAISEDSGFFPLEHLLSNQAVTATSGEVRHWSNGDIARTEFSASTGGHTAGGVFPAVSDTGDATSRNKYHRWSKDIPISEITEIFGQDLGTFQNFSVIRRDGIGSDGGRAREIRINFAHGSRVIPANTFRRALGISSTWFYITEPTGYHVLTATGKVHAFAPAQDHGSLSQAFTQTSAIDLAEVRSSTTSTTSSTTSTSTAAKGYWILSSIGEVHPFGAAQHYGSLAGVPIAGKVVRLVSTPTGRGYWLAAQDGGVFAFGDAGFYGSMGNTHLYKPITAIASTPTGEGYWLAAQDGGVFAFGDAGFYGSMAGKPLHKPIITMASTPTGEGYWLAAQDGGVFAFGDAPYLGSLPARQIRQEVVSLVSLSSGDGYLLAGREGEVHGFARARSQGGAMVHSDQTPTVAIAAP